MIKSATDNPNPKSERPTARPPADPHRFRLGELLIKKNIIRPEKLLEALTEQEADPKAPRLGVILMRSGTIAERDLLQCLSEQCGLPFIDVRAREIPQDVADRLPRETALQLMALPIEIKDGELIIAVADPLDEALIEQLKAAVHEPVRPAFACRQDLQFTVQRLYNNLVNSSSIAREFYDSVAVMLDSPDFDAAKFTELLLKLGINLTASALHILFRRFGLQIHLRLDGVLYPLPLPTRRLGAGRIAAIQSAFLRRARVDESKRHIPQTNTFDLKVDGGLAAMRLSIYPLLDGEKITIHFQKRFQFKRLEGLDINHNDQTLLLSALQRNSGLMIVTGIESGERQALLYALLVRLSKERRVIVTLEDPIAAALPFAAQSQISRDGPVTLEMALASLKYADADVVMVGEVRTTQTIRQILDAVLTGELFLVGVSGNGIVSTLLSIIQSGVSPLHLALGLTAIVSRRLLPRLCANCRTAHPRAKDLCRELGIDESRPLYSGMGCERCFNSGRSGQIAVQELLICDDVVRDTIAAGPTIGALNQLLDRHPSYNYRTDALQKCWQGLINPEDVLGL